MRLRWNKPLELPSFLHHPKVRPRHRRRQRHHNQNLREGVSFAFGVCKGSEGGGISARGGADWEWVWRGEGVVSRAYGC